MRVRDSQSPARSDARGTLTWWLAPGMGLFWRYPALLVVVALGLWYLFRALAHMSFLFIRHPTATFLLAFVLLPFGALPGYCFLFYAQRVPRLWRDTRQTGRRRLVLTIAGLPLAFVVAVMVDLLHIDLLRLMGIPLPRLPLDPF